MRTAHSIAIEVDRCLQLNLSNYEFDLLAEIISDSEDPKQTALNIINCGKNVAFYIINISKTNTSSGF